MEKVKRLANGAMGKYKRANGAMGKDKGPNPSPV